MSESIGAEIRSEFIRKANMKLADFLSILDTYLGNKVNPDSSTKRVNALVKLETFLHAFLVEGTEYDGPNISPDYAARILNGTAPLTSKPAAFYASNLDHERFEEFCGELSTEARENMAKQFQLFGEKVNADTLEKDVTSVLASILYYLVTVPPSASIRDAQFSGNNKVKINGKTINLPAALVPTDDEILSTENKYVDALLEVYAQDAKTGEITLETLKTMNPYYRQHFKIQRKNFFNAESVLHQIRDIFSDAETEFELLKDETLSGVEQTLIAPHRNALDRVEKTLFHVTVLNYGKSFLGRDNNGLIGASEKQGIIHMLVNDGKIEWIVDYDENI